jgi:hypothetical protein
MVSVGIYSHHHSRDFTAVGQDIGIYFGLIEYIFSSYFSADLVSFSYFWNYLLQSSINFSELLLSLRVLALKSNLSLNRFLTSFSFFLQGSFLLLHSHIESLSFLI